MASKETSVEDIEKDDVFGENENVEGDNKDSNPTTEVIGSGLQVVF